MFVMTWVKVRGIIHTLYLYLPYYGRVVRRSYSMNIKREEEKDKVEGG
jgi:hypothetical protein